MHRVLSGLVDDLEERARHLALGSTQDDADAIEALDAAAERARRRGAPSAAAELLELAIGLGAADAARRIRAARDHFHADNPGRAKEMLEDVVAELDSGPQRGEALALLGTIAYELDDFGGAVPILRHALENVGADPLLRVTTTMELVTALNNSGAMSETPALMEVALREAERTGDDALIAEATAGLVIVRFINGMGVDQPQLDRALALEDPDRLTHAYMWPSMCAMQMDVFTLSFGQARERIAAMHRRCVERGLETDLWVVLCYDVLASLPSGDIASAVAAVQELTERARMSGSRMVEALCLAMQAVVHAWVGDADEGRDIGARAVEALSSPPQASVLFAMAALGALELSVGDHEAAAGWLAPAAAQAVAIGMREPGMVPFLPDAAEALIALGRVDEAEPLVQTLETSGRNRSPSWAEAVGERCRGLMLAASGDMDGATGAFDRAT